MTTLKIGSINAATPTPLKPDGSFDKASAKKLCNRWRDIGLDGVFVLGSMGEGPLLSDEVRNAWVETALQEAGDSLTIFAGAADVSMQRMRERAVRYAKMGAHCVVLCIPPKLSPAQAVADVKAVADVCPSPCAYYDIPENTGTPLVLNEIFDILSHGNIKVCKDSSGSSLINRALNMPEIKPRDVFMMDGNEYQTPYSRLLGYDGVLHGGGVLTGHWVRKIWDLMGQGKISEAMELDRRKSLFIAKVYNRFSRPLQNAVGQKYALQLLGALDNAAVVNGQTLDDNGRARIKEAVAEYRDLIG